MARLRLEQAYPGLAFRPRTRNWWARLTRVPPECVHLETEQAWMATLVPDTLYLRGKAAPRRKLPRPEVSLCRRCLLEVLERELTGYSGRVVGFEPDWETFTQYFFVGESDFAAAGLQPEVAAAIEQRLRTLTGACSECSRPATWLWLSRQDVASLDDFGHIRAAAGRRLCAEHGARALSDAFEACAEANLFYINVPYGEPGAYVWI
ncbi:MAG TPA: hypothetical protein VKE24_06060 [Candidatus Acidoferrales bacterium]|nr:hypothetical protein [Candidatus Acidoferrales bacterium]